MNIIVGIKVGIAGFLLQFKFKIKMEFFGMTMYGPQNYIKDLLRDEYHEPMNEDEVKPVMKDVVKHSTCPDKIQRPDVDLIRIIDCYIGRVNGFAYGSKLRFNKMKRKGVIKPVGPMDMYRLPPTTSQEYGWFQCDPALTSATWYHTNPHNPQPMAPNTLILDKVRQNDRYATLF